MIADPGIARAFETTWPATESADTGALRTGRGLGAGGRVSSTIAIRPGWDSAQIAAAERLHHDWDQPAMFRVADSNLALQQALSSRGYVRGNPTAILAIDCMKLAGPLPIMMTFAIWPPIGIQRDLWAAGNVPAARQAVMDRVTGPRAALLGRLDDRAAGAAFVAVDGEVAMIHALEVSPAFRRRGLAGWLIRAGADWASGQGARRLGLAVSHANTGARTVYDRLGFREIGSYGYWTRP